MERAAFQRLRVYQLAEKIADLLWRIVMKWPPFDRTSVGGQLIRAADSIGANIAEGYGRGSPKDNHRFVRIARGSLNETIHFLRRAYRRKLISKEQSVAIKALLDELGPKLNNYLKSILGNPARKLS
jgi:four helix bundle protein